MSRWGPGTPYENAWQYRKANAQPKHVDTGPCPWCVRGIRHRGEPARWDEGHSSVGKVAYHSKHGKGVIRAYDAHRDKYLVYFERDEQTKETTVAKTPMQTIDADYRERYEKDKSVRTPSGSPSISNGDDVARALNGLDLDQCARVAKAAGISDRFKKWEDLNPGMQRMNLGNVIRALLRDKDTKDDAQTAIKMGRDMERVYQPKAGNGNGAPAKGKKAKKVKGKAKAKKASKKKEAVTEEVASE